MSDHEPSPEVSRVTYPAYVEFTVRMNVEDEDEFTATHKRIKDAVQTTTLRLHGDEAAVQVLWRRRSGARPIDSDPQEPPPFTFERTAQSDDAGTPE